MNDLFILKTTRSTHSMAATLTVLVRQGMNIGNKLDGVIGVPTWDEVNRLAEESGAIVAAARARYAELEAAIRAKREREVNINGVVSQTYTDRIDAALSALDALEDD